MDAISVIGSGLTLSGINVLCAALLESGVMAISDWLSVRVDSALLQAPVAGCPTRFQSEIGLQEGYTGK